MELEKIIKTVTAKIGVLEITRKSAERSLEKGDERDCERKLLASEEKISEIHELKLKVEEEKLVAGESLEDVENWGDELNEKLQIYEETVVKISSFLNSAKLKKDEEIRVLDKQKEEVTLNRVIEQEKKLHEAKLKLHDEYEKKVTVKVSQNAVDSEQVRIRLPKLSITKFDGTHTDFVRFWNMFTKEIDKTSIASISKFSYLKELVSPKVRLHIDGLPFSTEGYTRAKSILQSKYGKVSEIINAHV